MPRTQSGSNKKIKSNLIPDDHIDELIEKIEFQKPRNGFTHFVIEEIEKIKKKKKFDIKTDMKPIRDKWQKLDDSKKQAYHEKFEEEKKQYAKDLDAIRIFMFKGVNERFRSAPTAYKIYVNEKLQEAFENDKDFKEVKEQAKRDWAVMPIEKKQEYVEKKNENSQWFEKCKHLGHINSIAVFVTKTYEKMKSEGKILPKVSDVVKLWGNLSKNEKEKYSKYAEEINEERKKLKDLYELTKGIKPSRPTGAFKIFLQEKAANNEIHSIKSGAEMWKKLTTEQKDEYQKKAHKYLLAYRYKKLMYEKKIKKDYPKKVGNVFTFFVKDFKGKNIPGKNVSERMEYLRKQFEKLDKKNLKKYEEMREKAKEVYNKKVDEFKNRVYDLPSKPQSAYKLFIKDRLPTLYKEMKGKPLGECLKKCVEEWKNPKKCNQGEYEKLADKDKIRFTRELKEFNKLGYYLINNGKKEEKEPKQEHSRKKSAAKSAKKSHKKSAKKTPNLDKRSSSAKRSTKK